MPSPGNQKFVEPSFLASIVRKSEQLSIPQLVDALLAFGWSPDGLTSKVRASLSSALARPQRDCAKAEIVGHPIAAASCQLVCSSSDGSLDDIPFLGDRIRSDWRRHDQRGCCTQTVIYDTALTNEIRGAFSNCRTNSARLLRTRLWLDLLKKDGKAARSWQIFGRTMWPRADTCPAATYQNSKSQTVLAVIPNGDRFHIASDLSAAKKFATTKNWILEVYSLNFPVLNRRREKDPNGYTMDWYLDDPVFDPDKM